MNHPTQHSMTTSSVRAVLGAEVLIVDRDEAVRDRIASLVSACQMHATCTSDPAEACALMRRRFFSVAIVDLDTPHPDAGIRTLVSMQRVSRATSVLVLSATRNYDAALEILRAGAADIVEKSADVLDYLEDKLVAAAVRSLQQRQLGAVLQEAGAVHEDFLKLLMSAEQQVLDLEDSLAQREPKDDDSGMRILIVDPENRFAEEMEWLVPDEYEIVHVRSGGAALDRATSRSFQFAMVADELPDLPSSIVARSLKSQRPELVALSFRGPCEGGRVDVHDVGADAVVVAEFTKTHQLVDRLEDLSEAFRAKERQRRYTQAFRAKHYDFVRKFVSLKEKLEGVRL